METKQVRLHKHEERLGKKRKLAEKRLQKKRIKLPMFDNTNSQPSKSQWQQLIDQYKIPSLHAGVTWNHSNPPPWLDAVILCTCSICSAEKIPIPIDHRQTTTLTKIIQVTGEEFSLTHNEPLPVLKLPCDVYSRDGLYRLRLLYTEMVEGHKHYDKTYERSCKTKTFVSFDICPSLEKEILIGPFLSENDRFIYPSLAMAAKRARKRGTNGWEYFQVLLQHGGFVFRVPLRCFRTSDGGRGFINSNEYTEADIERLQHCAEISTNHQRIIDHS